MSNLKLRASWGQLGNQDALSDYYPWMNTYNLNAKYPFGGQLTPGYYQGSYDVLSALATLAFDGRREALFSKEFVNAMKMLERDHIQRHRMLGSWAGAMGQTQFMPSAFLNYAADGNMMA